MKTIAELKADGYEVRVTHLRNAYILEGRVILAPAHLLRAFGVRASSKMGATVVQLKKDGKVTTGLSVVHPKDNFNRKRGLAIALARALQE